MMAEGTPVRAALVLEDVGANYKIVAKFFERKIPGIEAVFVRSSSDAIQAIQGAPFYRLNPQSDQLELTDEKRRYIFAILDNQVPDLPDSNKPLENEGLKVAQMIRNMEEASQIGKMILFSYSADADQNKFGALFDRVWGKRIVMGDLAPFMEGVSDEKQQVVEKGGDSQNGT
ncbi:MAG: hypothetical protein JSS32_06020 [Verrucomicrobia bacterium]|nr:hypothetical protein [Verrucomicrobiota bacterium]